VSLILLGAGASSGVGGVLPSAPPLGRNLYKELAREFPETWGRVPPPLAAEFDGNFEIAMSRLWEAGEPGIAILMQQIGVFFARYRLPRDRRDAYSRLLDGLAARGRLGAVRFASLNYECLFEEAVEMSGRRVTYFADRPADGEVVVWKLHGSCNFLPVGAVPDPPPEAGLPPGVVVEADVRPVRREEVAPFCSRDSALYPAMAVYARGKPIQVAPSAITRTHRLWADAAAAAPAVVVVGVNPQPEDAHVWDPIARASGRVLYVGSRAAFDAWRRERRPADSGDDCPGERFDEAVERIVAAA
jgi:hypothetical protein